MIDNEFEQKCMQERVVTIPPTVTFIAQKEEKRLLAQQHENNSAYFLEGAQNVLHSNTTLLAILVGFFAMEHKANQLLALKGYKVQSHICTQMALSRILHKKDLARKISAVFNLRQSIGYRVYLKNNEQDRQNAQQVIVQDVLPFIEEIDRLIVKEDTF